MADDPNSPRERARRLLEEAGRDENLSTAELIAMAHVYATLASIDAAPRASEPRPEPTLGVRRHRDASDPSKTGPLIPADPFERKLKRPGDDDPDW